MIVCALAVKRFVLAIFRCAPAVVVAGFLGAAGPLEELQVWPPPPDPFSLLQALSARLPPDWRLGQPSSYLGIAQVRVNMAPEWRGNPIAAAINLCPDTEDSIWEQTRVIRLIMHQRQRDWPPYDCRP
jgi:hypothetical protein